MMCTGIGEVDGGFRFDAWNVVGFAVVNDYRDWPLCGPQDFPERLFREYCASQLETDFEVSIKLKRLSAVDSDVASYFLFRKTGC